MLAPSWMCERSERQARERRSWIAGAMAYMFEMRLFSASQYNQCQDFAETLWFANRNEGGEMMNTPQEAVDEEISYWGD